MRRVCITCSVVSRWSPGNAAVGLTRRGNNRAPADHRRAAFIFLPVAVGEKARSRELYITRFYSRVTRGFLFFWFLWFFSDLKINKQPATRGKRVRTEETSENYQYIYSDWDEIIIFSKLLFLTSNPTHLTSYFFCTGTIVSYTI